MDVDLDRDQVAGDLLGCPFAGRGRALGGVTHGRTDTLREGRESLHERVPVGHQLAPASDSSVDRRQDSVASTALNV